MNYKVLTLIIFTSLFTLSFAQAKPVVGEKITKGAMYRSNLGRTGVFKRVGISEKPSIKWTADIGGKIKSSPVYFEGNVYIGGAKGFYSLNAETGKQNWLFPIKKGVNSSACVANDTVLVNAHSKIYALDIKTGKQKWSYKASRESSKNYTSPAVRYGVVYASTGWNVVALNFKTGKRIFKLAKTRPEEYHSLVFGEKEFYVAHQLEWGFIFSYDLFTSRTNWVTGGGSYEAGAGVYFYKTPCVAKDESLYCNTTRGVRKFHPDKKFENDKKSRGRLWYNFLLEKDVEDNEYIDHSSPSVFEDLVFLGRKSGKFFALNTEDGKIAWQKKYSDSVLSDPSISSKSKIVYFGCNDKFLYALDTKTGSEKWKLELNEKIFSSPWLEDNTIFIADESGKVYCLK